jgi:hypothetical protein
VKRRVTFHCERRGRWICVSRFDDTSDSQGCCSLGNEEFSSMIFIYIHSPLVSKNWGHGKPKSVKY